MDGYTIFIGVVAVVIITLLVVGTIRRNRWGVNLKRPDCPTCGTPVPRVRRPDSLGQAIWGGWTCTNCGTKIDKWGRALSGPTRDYKAEA